MNKKKVIVILIVLALIGAVVFIFKSIGSNNKPPAPEEDLTQEKPTLSKKLKTFTDASGFKFSYAENLELSTVETKEETTYSKLEIVSPDLEGIINIDVQQTDMKTFDQWRKASDLTIKDSQVKKIKLGDLTAQQFTLNGNTTTVALDEGVLFTLKVSPEEDKSYWQEAYNKIVGTFALTPPPANTAPLDSSGGGSGEEDLIFEGEEIVE